MSTFEIRDFYNQGAQVVVKGAAVDMTHSFTADASDGEEIDIGYVPRPNSKIHEGYSFDLLEHEGVEYLLLKGGHVYDVTITQGEKSSKDVISAEEGHLSLKLPRGADVDVYEHDPNTGDDNGKLRSEDAAGAADDPEE